MKIKTLRRNAVAGAMAFLGLMTAGAAQATNGYFANGYGGGSKGMAGSGVAVPTGVLGLAQNPAMGMKVGNQAGFCLTLFAPDRGFDVSGAGGLAPGSYDSRNDLFAIPCGGVNFKLNDRSAVGLFMFGNGGMNTEYSNNVFVPGFGTAGSTPLGVNLEQLFIAVNYTYQISNQVTVGVAPVFAVQRFSATGLENFAGFSMAPANLTNNGDDWSTGGGFNLGLLYEPNAAWSIGVAYRSKMQMSKFDKYAGLFAEQGDFDIPAVATIGAAYTPPSAPQWTISTEYQRIFYSDVASISNSGAVITTAFGANDGPGFGWDDMDVIRLAAIYRYSDKLTLRGGVSYSSKFIKNDEALLNILAPATPQWHISLGASYKINDRWGVTTSFTHVPDATVTGSNPSLAPTQPVTLRMNQNEFALGMTYRW